MSLSWHFDAHTKGIWWKISLIFIQLSSLLNTAPFFFYPSATHLQTNLSGPPVSLFAHSEMYINIFDCLELDNGDARVKSLWVRIRQKANKADIIVTVCYRPPKQDEDADEIFHKPVGEVTTARLCSCGGLQLTRCLLEILFVGSISPAMTNHIPWTRGKCPKHLVLQVSMSPLRVYPRMLDWEICFPSTSFAEHLGRVTELMLHEELKVFTERIKTHAREWISPVSQYFGMMGTNCEFFCCRHE